METIGGWGTSTHGHADRNVGVTKTTGNVGGTDVEEDKANVLSLLKEARRGNAEAFGELCRCFETRLLRQAVALSGNVDVAEDLAQDTLVEAWRCLHRYNGKCQFFTWLCAILLNRYRSHLRATCSRPLYHLDNSAESGIPQEQQASVSEVSPDSAAALRDQARLIQECISALSEKHQQVIYLRFYVDNSLESIAAALGCSVGTVKSRLFHALEKLRAMKLMNEQFSNLTQLKECHETL